MPAKLRSSNRARCPGFPARMAAGAFSLSLGCEIAGTVARCAIMLPLVSNSAFLSSRPSQLPLYQDRSTDYP